MATAALHRMDRPELVAAELPGDRFVAAVGQGAIGLEIREDRSDIAEILATVCDPDTVAAVTAERIFMAALEGGCSVPVAAHASRANGQWQFSGWIGSLDGQTVLHETVHGEDPSELSRTLSAKFLEAGAREILGR